jgi:hypothetical protein
MPGTFSARIPGYSKIVYLYDGKPDSPTLGLYNQYDYQNPREYRGLKVFFLPEFLKGIEIPEFGTHKVNDNTATIYQFPAIPLRILVPVIHLKAKVIEFAPELMGYTFEMPHTVYCTNYETVCPGAVTAYIQDIDILAFMVF